MKKLFTLLILLCAIVTAHAADRIIYMSPGEWNNDNPNFYAWIWGGSGSSELVKFTYNDKSGYFLITISDDRIGMILFRRDPSLSEPVTNTFPADGTYWNKTGDITLNSTYNLYTFSGWSNFTAGTYTPYTVAGLKEIVNGSTNWNELEAENNMSTSDGETYTLTVDDVDLVEGNTYSFKVVKNHNWNTSFPNDNYTFTVDRTGKYNITYNFTVSDSKVSYTINATQIYVYVRKDNETAPNFYIWNDDTYGEWGGIQLTTTETFDGVEYWKSGPIESTGKNFRLFKHGCSDEGYYTSEQYAGYDLFCSYDEESTITLIPSLVYEDGGWKIAKPLNLKSDGTYSLSRDIKEYKRFILSNDGDWLSPSTDYMRAQNGSYALSKGWHGTFQTYAARTYNFVLSSDKSELQIIPVELALKYFKMTGEGTYNSSNYEAKFTKQWDFLWCYLDDDYTHLKGNKLVLKTTDNATLGINVVYTDSSNEWYGGTMSTFNVDLDPSKLIKQVEIKNSYDGEQDVTLRDIYITQTSSLNSDGEGGYWATYVAPYNMSFADNNNLEVNIVTYENDIIRKAPVKSKEVPQGKTVLLYYPSGSSSIDAKVISTLPQLPRGNKLTSGARSGVVASDNIYGLSKGTKGVGFYKVVGDIPEGKGYLNLTEGLAAPQFLWFDGETTAIDALNNEIEPQNDGKVYDLSGRLVTGKLPKGLYVKNGKKFIVK